MPTKRIRKRMDANGTTGSATHWGIGKARHSREETSRAHAFAAIGSKCGRRRTLLRNLPTPEPPRHHPRAHPSARRVAPPRRYLWQLRNPPLNVPICRPSHSRGTQPRPLGHHGCPQFVPTHAPTRLPFRPSPNCRVEAVRGLSTPYSATPPPASRRRFVL